MNRKCKECKWLTGEKRSIGVECMNPENQKKWNEREILRKKAGYSHPEVVARYKQPSGKACSKFEPRLNEADYVFKVNETDCAWGRCHEW